MTDINDLERTLKDLDWLFEEEADDSPEDGIDELDELSEVIDSLNETVDDGYFTEASYEIIKDEDEQEKWVIVTDEYNDREIEVPIEKWHSRIEEANDQIVGMTTGAGIEIVRIPGHVIAATFTRPKCTVVRMVRVLEAVEEPKLDNRKGYYRYRGEGIAIFVDHVNNTRGVITSVLEEEKGRK